jgi:hypothetical protein
MMTFLDICDLGAVIGSGFSEFKSTQLINNIKMEKTYRLEFNEKQQNFHLDNYTHEPNTFGWFTITDHCSDFEFKVFEAYVNRVEKHKLTKNYLLKCLSEIKGLMDNLQEYKLHIVRF